MKSYWVVLAIGVALRIAALPMGGTYDVFKGWSYVAATHGEARLYDWAGAPDDHSLRMIDGWDARADYPPLALYELGFAGRAYRWAFNGRFPRTDILTAVIKVPALLAEATLAILLFVTVRRAAGVRAARRLALIYWMNPAIILTTSVHGYVDMLFVLPAVGALIAAVRGRPALAGGLMAAALLTKPLAVFVAPALALALWNVPCPHRRSQIRAAVTGAAFTAVAILAPMVAAGAIIDMTRAVGNRLLGFDLLSNALNLWWIVGHLLQQPGLSLTSFVMTPADIVPISAFTSFDPPTARMVVRFLGSVLPLAVIAWGIWTARYGRDLWLLAGTAAFIVHAYVVLATQVHENHLFAAVPLLALATAGRPEFFRLFLAMTAIVALNMNLLYGLGDDLRYALPRTLTIVDATLILATANCAALVWHASVLRRSCRAA